MKNFARLLLALLVAKVSADYVSEIKAKTTHAFCHILFYANGIEGINGCMDRERDCFCPTTKSESHCESVYNKVKKLLSNELFGANPGNGESSSEISDVWSESSDDHKGEIVEVVEIDSGSWIMARHEDPPEYKRKAKRIYKFCQKLPRNKRMQFRSVRHCFNHMRNIYCKSKPPSCLQKINQFKKKVAVKL